MKSSRLLISVLGLLVLVASSAAVQLFRENRELRRQLGLAGEIGAGRTTANEVAAMETASERVSDRSPPLAPPASSDEPQPAAGIRRDDRRARLSELAGRLAQDPEARAARLGQIKADIDRTYGDLFVKLGLNEDQVDMLRSLLAERQMARMEGGMRSRFAGDDEDARAAIHAESEAKLQSIESGINEILGPDGTTVLDDFQRSQPARQAVSDVARRANYAGAPLSLQASEQLVTAMAAAAQEFPVPNAGGARWRREPLTQDAVSIQLAAMQAQNEAVLARATGFLDQAQLEALISRQIEQYEQTQAQLNVRLRNADAGFFGGPRGERGGRGPGGASP